MLKKMIAVIGIFCILFSFGGCSNSDYEVLDGSQENYKLFRSTPLGFAMEFPKSWGYVADMESKVVKFDAPQEGYSDEFKEAVSVARIEVDGKEDGFDTFAKSHRAQLEKLKHYKMVEEGKAKLGGEDAYRLVYELTDGKEEDANQMRFLNMIARKDDYIYIVTYAGDFSSYSYFLTHFNKMVETFEFIG